MRRRHPPGNISGAREYYREGGRSILKAFHSWSLVTVSYNSGEKLKKYWQGDKPAHVEWIVVDNGSTDDSVFQAKKLGAKVIALERNVGFGAANNIGFALAESSFIGFVNPDVKVDFSSLDHMGETLSKSQVLLAPQLIDDYGNLQPNGRGLPTIWAKISSRLRAGSASGRGYLLMGTRNPSGSGRRPQLGARLGARNVQFQNTAMEKRNCFHGKVLLEVSSFAFASTPRPGLFFKAASD